MVQGLILKPPVCACWCDKAVTLAVCPCGGSFESRDLEEPRSLKVPFAASGLVCRFPILARFFLRLQATTYFLGSLPYAKVITAGLKSMAKFGHSHIDSHSFKKHKRSATIAGPRTIASPFFISSDRLPGLGRNRPLQSCHSPRSVSGWTTALKMKQHLDYFASSFDCGSSPRQEEVVLADAMQTTVQHRGHGRRQASTYSLAAARRSTATGTVPVKRTPKTGRISQAKKGLLVHTCELCRPPKVGAHGVWHGGLVCDCWRLMAHYLDILQSRASQVCPPPPPLEAFCRTMRVCAGND